MCNAYNHPPGCRCGWGGDGHLGVSSNFQSPIDSADKCCHFTSCPKCGQSVFFIRHNGGSVWVDELGPPWPKHPCFDGNNEKTHEFISYANEIVEYEDYELAFAMRREEYSAYEIMLEVKTVYDLDSRLIWSRPFTIFAHRTYAPVLRECFFISREKNDFFEIQLWCQTYGIQSEAQEII
jgi:hypothetical protein